MARPVSVQRSGLVAAPVQQVFDVALSTPLPQLYRRRYGPLPPIVAVHDQRGAWETVGQQRTFVLGDGGRMLEEMIALAPGRSFTNRLTVLAGPFRPLVAEIVETWSFAPEGAATRASWDWNLSPRSPLTRPPVLLVARLWRGYAREVLAQLREECAPG